MVRQVGARRLTDDLSGGQGAVVSVIVILAATEPMMSGTGIANVRARDPRSTRGASALLAQAWARGFVLGSAYQAAGRWPSVAGGVGRALAERGRGRWPGVAGRWPGVPRSLATPRDYLDWTTLMLVRMMVARPGAQHERREHQEPWSLRPSCPS